MKEARQLLDTKEVLSQEEYDLCFTHFWEETRACTTRIGMANDRYLNLNVYSEADKEDRDLRMETGL